MYKNYDEFTAKTSGEPVHTAELLNGWCEIYFTNFTNIDRVNTLLSECYAF